MSELSDRCDDGTGSSCKALGKYFRAHGEEDAALRAYEKGCRHGTKAACVEAERNVEATEAKSELDREREAKRDAEKAARQAEQQRKREEEKRRQREEKEAELQRQGAKLTKPVLRFAKTDVQWSAEPQGKPRDGNLAEDDQVWVIARAKKKAGVIVRGTVPDTTVSKLTLADVES